MFGPAQLILLTGPLISWAAVPSRVFPGPLSPQAATSPQCPNNQPPKLDRNGFPIQCLPGAGQFDVCGPLHTCFFSGLNYMCCPTNEPPADAHPICPNGLHTVIDHEYRSVLCAPGRLACPAAGQLCLHAGRTGHEYVCCEQRPQGVPKSKMSPTATTHHHKKHHATHSPKKELRPTTCPMHTLAVISAEGNAVTCSERRQCPGATHICHGTSKHAICCQKYETAGNLIENDSDTFSPAFLEKMQGNRERLSKKKEVYREKKSSDIEEQQATVGNVHAAGLKRQTRPKKAHKNKVDKRQKFLNEVQHVHDAEQPARSTTRKRLRKQKSTTTPLPEFWSEKPSETTLASVTEEASDSTTIAATPITTVGVEVKLSLAKNRLPLRKATPKQMTSPVTTPVSTTSTETTPSSTTTVATTTQEQEENVGKQPHGSGSD